MLDQEPEYDTDTKDKTDDALYCAECGDLMTRTRWAISMDGHERVFINPAGRVFRICCFSDAPGANDVGPLTSEPSWFPGFEWNFAICASCNAHIGWRFISADLARSFVGLMKTALTTSPIGGKS